MGGPVKERSLSFRGVPTVRARVTKHHVQKSRGEWHVPSFRCGEAKNGPRSCSVQAVRHLRHPPIVNRLQSVAARRRTARAEQTRQVHVHPSSPLDRSLCLGGRILPGAPADQADKKGAAGAAACLFASTCCASTARICGRYPLKSAGNGCGWPSGVQARRYASASTWRATARPSSATPAPSDWGASSQSDGMPATGRAGALRGSRSRTRVTSGDRETCETLAVPMTVKAEKSSR